MAWPSPSYSRKAVARAGKLLANPGDASVDEMLDAFEVLSNWRACHGYPINTFQATLRNKLSRITDDSVVSQRLKRAPSIVAKLRKSPQMKLSRMQDIGGLRAVVPSMAAASALKESYLASRFEHELVANTDYVASPKGSGYRGYHLVYRYRNRANRSYDGLRVELQIRTKVQHAWATAVEVAGTFLKQSLKSSEGPDEWLRFFGAASAGLATLEDCPPGNEFKSWTIGNLRERVNAEGQRLKIAEKLGAFSVALDAIKQDPQPAEYYLIVLDSFRQELSITTYAKPKLEQATRDYAITEREIQDREESQAVLVSASSLDQIRRAYPNYFLDTREFLVLLDTFIHDVND